MLNDCPRVTLVHDRFYDLSSKYYRIIRTLIQETRTLCATSVPFVGTFVYTCQFLSETWGYMVICFFVLTFSSSSVQYNISSQTFFINCSSKQHATLELEHCDPCFQYTMVRLFKARMLFCGCLRLVYRRRVFLKPLPLPPVLFQDGGCKVVKIKQGPDVTLNPQCRPPVITDNLIQSHSVCYMESFK